MKLSSKDAKLMVRRIKVNADANGYRLPTVKEWKYAAERSVCKAASSK